MKKLILFPDFFRLRYYLVGQVLLIPYFLFSQNVGIGTSTPYNKLSVAGNLVVTQPTTGINSAPTLQNENEELNKRIKLLETDKNRIETLQQQLQMLEEQIKKVFHERIKN